MDFTEKLSTKQRLFVISCIVLGIGFFSTAVLFSSGGSNQKKEDRLPTLKDSTGSFKVISLEKKDPFFVMQVQNISDKAITAYTKGVCDYPESSSDYSLGGGSIKPGEIVKIDTPSNAVADHCDPAKTPPTITFLAVIFEDKTYAGEFQWAKGMLDNRRGLKIQLKRINALLAKASKWPDVEKAVAIERLSNQIASLPIDEGEGSAVQGGLSSAQQRALFLLDELKKWQQQSLTTQSLENIPVREELMGIKNVQEGLGKLIAVHEKWISRY
jgi:hypothetical protein